MYSCRAVPPGTVAAHSALVYDLCWSADGHVVVSCSSDCTAKAWYLEAACEHMAATRGRQQAPPAGASRAALPFCTVLHHPTFVYSCKVHPHTQLLAGGAAAAARCGVLIIATSCADGAVRFWGLRGDADPRADPDGTAPLLQLVVGVRQGPGAAPSGVNAVLWDPPAEADAGLGDTTRGAGSTAGQAPCAHARMSSMSAVRQDPADDGASAMFTGLPPALLG